MKVFVDTNFFYARVSRHDQWHAMAARDFDPGIRAITSSLVVNETISLFQLRGFLSAGLDFLHDIRSDPDIQIVHVDAVLQAEGWDLFHRWGGAGANAVDCVSFAIMKSFSIRKALTFDRHFRTAGFEVLP
ncbi:MAG TPA: PIN domain-containing protein [Bryobacteraceae bacterium]|nr:PIN domain-containing protein [Bryobacteraceae bacterium]